VTLGFSITLRSSAPATAENCVYVPNTYDNGEIILAGALLQHLVYERTSGAEGNSR
jgi:hypothetical protein